MKTKRQPTVGCKKPSYDTICWRVPDRCGTKPTLIDKSL